MPLRTTGQGISCHRSWATDLSRAKGETGRRIAILMAWCVGPNSRHSASAVFAMKGPLDCAQSRQAKKLSSPSSWLRKHERSRSTLSPMVARIGLCAEARAAGGKLALPEDLAEECSCGPGFRVLDHVIRRAFFDDHAAAREDHAVGAFLHHRQHLADQFGVKLWFCATDEKLQVRSLFAQRTFVLVDQRAQEIGQGCLLLRGDIDFHRHPRHQLKPAQFLQLPIQKLDVSKIEGRHVRC